MNNMLVPFRRAPSEPYDDYSERLAFFSDWTEWNRMKHLRTILELDSRGCKWPVATSEDGTHLFCNELQRDNSSYCQEHYRLSVMPAKARAA